MKKIVFTAIAMAVFLPAIAQDTYESARLLGNDLNGTARYVGMGGAMEALGADISTISTNPAGIGLFRHSTASISLGLVSQQDAVKFDGLNKTNMSFDQVGIVYSARPSQSTFINFAFNYHKSRNFDQILSAANSLRGCSQNGLTYYKAKEHFYEFDFNKDDEVMGWENGTDYRAQNFSQADYLNANVLADEVAIEDGRDGYYTDLMYHGMGADTYNFDRAHRGWINDFDFTLSGNSNDRFYWGVTVGIHDVNYKGYSEYAEGLVSIDGSDGGIVSYGDMRTIKGTGVDMKFGVIARPMEYSPFRVGLYIHTPIWYDLTSENTTALYNLSALGECLDGSYIESGDIENSYDFRFYTPWKFGLSLGHTIGNNVAIGATYEFSDYGASQNRVKDGYDSYGNEDSYKDNVMKSVSTLKVGLEFKPVPQVALRAGYNYVSPAYSENGVRDQTLNSYGVKYASTSDYVNWKGTNRITAGLGCKLGSMNLDVAYQYSTTDGVFYPFQPNLGGSVTPANVSNKRHQVLFTLGYTF